MEGRLCLCEGGWWCLRVVDFMYHGCCIYREHVVHITKSHAFTLIPTGTSGASYEYSASNRASNMKIQKEK